MDQNRQAKEKGNIYNVKSNRSPGPFSHLMMRTKTEGKRKTKKSWN